MAFKNIYIVADVEGIAGLAFYEYRDKDMSMLNYELLHRNRMLLTEEVNAACRGAFDAGAEKVVVHDCHGDGYTLIPELLDERLELIHGRADQHFSMGLPHPDLEDGFDAMVLIGMHAKAGTVNGCTPHSLLYTETSQGKVYELSEATMSMAIAGDCGIPCIFIAADKATVEDALALNRELKYVITKKNYASQVTRTISPVLSRKRIYSEINNALKCSNSKPFVITGPCSVRIADRNPAALWPEKPELCASFTEALVSTLHNVPWYEPIEEIDDGWRYPDRSHPEPCSKWNMAIKRNTK